MKIITLGRFFAIFTIVKCIPFPPDPGDSEPEIIADNLPSSDSDSGSDNDVIIVTDPPVIRIPSSPDNSGPEDHDMDEQPAYGVQLACTSITGETEVVAEYDSVPCPMDVLDEDYTLREPEDEDEDEEEE